MSRDNLSPDNEELPDFETLCAHWAEDRSRFEGAVIPPIFQNSLFVSPSIETRYSAGSLFDYTRVNNPTTDILERKIAALERTDTARCFGSGMAAISSAILSTVQTGDHVIAVSSAYGPTQNFLSNYVTRFGITCTFVEGSDPQHFVDAVQANTRLIYLESPSSGIFRQQDLEAVAQFARSKEIITIADNSWASPYFQNPCQFGVDMVVHSATKYLGGHSDIVAGVAAGRADIMKVLAEREGQLLGGILDPFASWLMLRGVRTLPVRLKQHQETTREIVARLLAHPSIKFVNYPGCPTDPQPDLTAKQLRGTSGLFSFGLKSNSREQHFKLVNSLKWFGIGVSWGGFESLALPLSAPGEQMGITDKHRYMCRLHVGLENVEDLWKDIEQAIDKAES